MQQPPTLIQLRDRLGRELVKQPDSPVLHGALRVLTRAVERREQLNRWQRLAAARASALALDVATHAQQSAGLAEPLLSDALDPGRRPELGWWASHTPPQHAELAALLDQAADGVREGDKGAVPDVTAALERTYQALGQTSATSTRAKAVATGAVGVFVGWGLSRLLRGRRG